MRIISGCIKGRKLTSLSSRQKIIRPTPDRAREALFNILNDKISGAHVLDLFSGTGALGLESLSRDAALVVLVDNNKYSQEIIKKNIGLCLPGYQGDCKLHLLKIDLKKSLKNHFTLVAPNGFDLIFADPPYDKKISHHILENIDKSDILRANGILIIEERSTATLPPKLNQLTNYDKRIYGDTGFWFYTYG